MIHQIVLPTKAMGFVMTFARYHWAHDLEFAVFLPLMTFQISNIGEVGEGAICKGAFVGPFVLVRVFPSEN